MKRLRLGQDRDQAILRDTLVELAPGVTAVADAFIFVIDDAGALVVNMVSPTAGLFDGDEVDVSLVVESGARAVFTTPAATRIHRARGDRPAVVRQSLTVHSGGFIAGDFPFPREARSFTATPRFMRT